MLFQVHIKSENKKIHPDNIGMDWFKLISSN